MKNILFIIYVVFLFLQCNPQHTSNRKKLAHTDTLKNAEKDSIMYVWWLKSGVFNTDNGLYLADNDFLLNLCMYQNQKTLPVFLSKTQIKYLLQKEVLPALTEVSGTKLDSINYDYNRLDSIPVCYYEIINTGIYNCPKTVGRLYEIATRCCGLNRGSVFISDTTDAYGWFVLDIPTIHKPPSTYHFPLRTTPHIISLHPKARFLKGKYERISRPYRIIRNEEITKNKSK